MSHAHTYLLLDIPDHLTTLAIDAADRYADIHGIVPVAITVNQATIGNAPNRFDDFGDVFACTTSDMFARFVDRYYGPIRGYSYEPIGDETGLASQAHLTGQRWGALA
jgi:hypothetical protein